MSMIFSMAVGAALMLALIIVVTRYAGFLGQRPGDYATTDTGMDVRTALDGPLICDGIIYGPFGRVVSRFTAKMAGQWVGNTGILTETFFYDSGAVQDRVWSLTLAEDDTIHAEAPDLVGPGRGRQRGDAVCLHYSIRLPDDAGAHVLRVTDWMYLSPSGVIVNRSQFRKYGIKVGELIATMRRDTGA